MTDLSLTLTSTFVADLAALRAPIYKAEDITLDDFAFLPFVRSGLAAGIRTAPTDGAIRAVITAAFDVSAADETGDKQAVSRDLTLYGPGDVTGIDPSQIIRREPTPGTVKSEETMLAHVEFDRPDLPWLFTPLPSDGNTLKPWLALILVDATVSQILPSGDERPARVRTLKGELQSLATNHLFAHAQVVGAAVTDAGTYASLAADIPSSLTARLSDEHGPANLSRLICPRNPAPNRRYIAALVPAFDCGVCAGLGLGGGTLDDAWTRMPDNSDALSEIILPIYDHWEFTTGAEGDFRSLAEKIKGIAAPWQIGRRTIDMSQPGGQIPSIPQGTPGAVQILKCALYAPASPPDASLEEIWPATQRQALRDRVNEGNEDVPDLPRVGPRMYARHQAGEHRIGVQGEPFNPVNVDAHWFSQINTDPAQRIVAGLGTRVVQKDQEQLMQAAWAQVDGVRKANQALIWAQFAQTINISAYQRHVAPLELGRLAQFSRNIHGRIKLGSQVQSLASTVLASSTSQSVVSAAYRRATRASAPVMKRTPETMGAMFALSDHRVAYANPDGITAVAISSLQVFSDDQIARVMGVNAVNARAALTAKMTEFARTGPAFSEIAQKDWTPRPGVVIGDAIASVLLATVETQLPAAGTPAGSVIDQLPNGAVLAGIAQSSGATAAKATERLSVLNKTAVKQTIMRSTMPQALPNLVAPPLRDLNLPGLNARGVSGLANRFETGRRIMPFGRGIGPLLVDPAPSVHTPAVALPDTPTQRFSTPLSSGIAKAITTINAQPVAQVLASMRSIVTAMAAAPAALMPLPALSITKPLLLAELSPAGRGLAAFKGRVRRLPDCISPNWFDRVGLRQIMAAPEFKRPMYQALYDYNRDWLVPGLTSLPQRNFVTLLKVNPAFCESFLVGASDEMGRELLWRNYPTDQSGTYFRRFWDADADELTKPIHQFPSESPLGRHFSTGGAGNAGIEPLVLVIRGELVQRYPNLVAAAVQEMPDGGDIDFAADGQAEILFTAHLAPDFKLVGFNLTEENIRTGKWWFLLAENPTAPRFGTALVYGLTESHLYLTPTDGSVPLFVVPHGNTSIIDDNEDGSKPKSVPWPGHAGTVARGLLHNPVRAAFDAKTLINSITTIS